MLHSAVTRNIQTLTIIVQVYVLKEKVKANIAEKTFVEQPDLPPVGLDLEFSGSKHGWFYVNLQVLWTSPEITVCDMYNLSQFLAQEIYHHTVEVNIYIRIFPPVWLICLQSQEMIEDWDGRDTITRRRSIFNGI